jgi:hypothetical protein
VKGLGPESSSSKSLSSKKGGLPVARPLDGNGAAGRRQDSGTIDLGSDVLAVSRNGRESGPIDLGINTDSDSAVGGKQEAPSALEEYQRRVAKKRAPIPVWIWVLLGVGALLLVATFVIVMWFATRSGPPPVEDYIDTSQVAPDVPGQTAFIAPAARV